MTLLIDLFYLAAGVVLSPYILFRMLTSRRWRDGFFQRLGLVDPRSGVRPCVWVHAVSVGEINAVKPLLDMIAEEHPEWEVYISSTTNTGRRVAAERYGDAHCIYFPLDLSFLVRRVLRRLRPHMIVLVELELWPNMLRCAATADIPVVIVNGRMRESSVWRYKLLAPVLKPAMRGALNYFCVQNETYRDRFVRAGFRLAKIEVTGNMKYDSVRTEVDPTHLQELRQALAVRDGERLWVAGCTWPGEEAMCLAAHRELQKTEPGLRLVIAPRHIERASDVAREISRAGYGCRRRSKRDGPSGPDSVGLLDTVGELHYLYAPAEFAFVGKSLVGHGGHNMLEPAGLGVPPVFGPNTENFQEEAEVLLDGGAAQRVYNLEDLINALRRLLTDTDLRTRRSNAGRDVVLLRKGASRRNFGVIQRLMNTVYTSGERGTR
jgi:3-deoxy-D-manno-octulosonic-acid transferase